MVKNSLSKKIIASVSFIILLVGGLVTFLVYTRISNTLISFKKDEIIKLNTAQSRELSQVFYRSKEFVKLIAIRTRVVDYLDSPTKSKEKELIDIFDEYPPFYPQYLSIYLMNDKGDTLVSTDKTFVGKNYGFRDYFTKAMQGESYTEALMGTTSKQFGYYFSSPVINKKGLITGVVVVKLDGQIIDNILTEDQKSRDSYIMLTDSHGVVLYSQKKDRVLKSIGKLDTKELQEIVDKKKFIGKKISSLQYDEVQLIIKDYQEPKVIEIYDQKDKEQEILGVIKINSTPYFLVTEIEVDELKKFAFEIAFVLSIAVLIAAILALVVVTFVIKIFLQPLGLFQDFSSAISRGDFKKRLNITSKDEFGQLATTLNSMAVNLEDMYHNLDEKVKEKTKDLAKFQLAVDHVSDHIVITDKDGIILYANEAVTKITGFSVREILGKKAGSKELWGGLMAIPVYKKFWKQVKTDKKPFTGEFNNHRKNGEDYIAEAHVSPILDDEGNVVFFVGIERDITRAKEVDRMKTEFISLASHQLRTPLSAMRWFLEMLLNGDAGKLTRQQKEFVNNIDKSNTRMIELVNSLLNISRIESGRIIIDPKPINLKQLVDSLINEIKIKADEKKQTIITSIHDNLPLIKLDPKLISEVILNLLSNAIKYSPEKTDIIITISKSDQEVIVQVSDNGLGIPKKEQDHIFIRFFRATNVVKNIIDGNGLGLYLVKAIIESSGGKIWFKSQEGKGSSFFFSLPITGMKSKKGEVGLN